MLEGFSALPTFIEKEKVMGCFADTTVLFSFSYSLDIFNADSESVLRPLCKADIPIFSNVNVRAEFLENHRRVIIAEGLIDFLEDSESKIDGVLAEKLKAHRTSYRRKLADDKSVKMDVNQIRSFRNLLSSYNSPKGNGWEMFCGSYLRDKLETIWSSVKSELNVELISLRSEDESPYLNSIPQWEDATTLMGKHGIASADAMILNMFLCSKIPVLLTADMEMAEVANKEAKGSKIIFVPDSALS